MARTSVWRSALLVAVVATLGCNENLTTACGSPALCPSNNVQLADTLLAAPVVSDTSVRGYVLVREAAFLLASSLDSLKSVILIRFTPMPDRWFPTAGDTVGIRAAMPPDSVRLSVQVGQRDTAVKQLHVIFYRLPAQFDTALTYAQAQPYFADSLVVADTLLPDTMASGVLTVRMPDTLVAPAADSGVISLGVRVVAAAPTAFAISSGQQNSTSPVLLYYVHGQSPNDTLKRVLSETPAFATFVQSPDPSAVVPGVLSVGGLPSARAILHLALPKVVLDSNAIVRATLILNTVQPVVGFARDSFYVEVRPMLRDFGLKSILYPDSSISGHTLVHEGQSGMVQVDIEPILRLWGTTRGDSLPLAIVLRVFPEGSVLGQADFKGWAAGVAGGAPELRVTYVKKYDFGVP